MPPDAVTLAAFGILLYFIGHVGPLKPWVCIKKSRAPFLRNGTGNWLADLSAPIALRHHLAVVLLLNHITFLNVF